jgi:hypothetical protein
VQQRDLILALNGNAVSDANSFRNDIARTPPEQTVTLRIWRGGTAQGLRPILSEFIPQQREVRATDSETSEPLWNDDGRLGISVQPLKPALAPTTGIET